MILVVQNSNSYYSLTPIAVGQDFLSACLARGLVDILLPLFGRHRGLDVIKKRTFYE